MPFMFGAVPQIIHILKELVTKQKMTICIIHNSSYNAHTESLFKTSEILPLLLLADFFKLQFMYLHKFAHLPVSFRDMWISNAERTMDADPPAVCDEEDVPYSRLCSSNCQPLVYFPRLWDEFMHSCNIGLFGIPHKNLFERELKAHFLGKLSDDYQCSRLLCPHFHLVN
jgi:hypothetical protein